MVNISHGSLARSLRGENPNQWDVVLAQAEFSYNGSANKSTSKTYFQIVYGRSLEGVVDLINLPYLEEIKSVDSSDFSNSIWEMNE